MNKLYHISNKSLPLACPLVVRVNGLVAEQYCLDRDKELCNMSLYRDTDILPVPVGSFTNGIIYKYIEGDKLSKEDIQKDNTLLR